MRLEIREWCDNAYINNSIIILKSDKKTRFECFIGHFFGICNAIKIFAQIKIRFLINLSDFSKINLTV